MSSQTLLAGLTGVANPPKVLSGDEIYDSIMSQIEPELTVAFINTLKEKYNDETPEQAQVRADRYNAAFAEYDKRFAEYSRTWQEQWEKYKHTVMQSLESDTKMEEEANLKNMEDQISQI